MGTYRAYTLWSIIIFVIVAGLISIKAPANLLTASSEALRNIFGQQKTFVEVIDTKIEEASVETEEVRVVGALSGPNSTFVTDVSRSGNIDKKVEIKIENIIYDVEGADEGRERIVIKNQSTSSIDISNFSVQYLKFEGDYGSISKKNFESGHQIKGNGEFVIGANCKSIMPCLGVDMSWSQALGNNGGAIYLVSSQENISDVGDSDIVSFLKY